LVSWNWLSLAVNELDWGVMTVLSEKGNSLLSSFDLREKLPDIGTLTDVVGFSGLEHLVFTLVFGLLDDVAQAFEVHTLVFFVFHNIFIHLHSVGLVLHLFIHVHLIHLFIVLFLDALGMLSLRGRQWWQLGSVDHSRGSLTLTLLLHGLTSWLLVREHGQRVLGKLNISVEVVQTLVV
jgi:hypothetical protein